MATRSRRSGKAEAVEEPSPAPSRRRGGDGPSAASSAGPSPVAASSPAPSSAAPAAVDPSRQLLNEYQEALKDKALEKFSLGDVESLVNMTARYCIFTNAKKHIIKWSAISKDVVNNVLPKYKGKGPELLMKLVNLRLQYVFGYELAEVPRRRIDNKGNAVTSSERSFILRTVHQSDTDDLLNFNSVQSDMSLPSQGFLMMVAQMVFLSHNELVESELWSQLEHLDVTQHNRKNHPQLGNVEQLMQTFVTQGYFIREKQAEAAAEAAADGTRPDANAFVYRLGPRAKLEFEPAELYKFGCQSVGGVPDQSVLLDIAKREKAEKDAEAKILADDTFEKKPKAKRKKGEPADDGKESKKASKTKATPKKKKRKSRDDDDDEEEEPEEEEEEPAEAGEEEEAAEPKRKKGKSAKGSQQSPAAKKPPRKK